MTPQGRFLYDFFISEDDDALLLETEASRVDDLAKRLKLYKLRAQVTLNPRPDLMVYLLWGDELLAASRMFPDPRLPAFGYRCYADAVEGTNVSLEDYHAHRLHLGVPEAGIDLIPEKSIPLECNLDELKAISWDKGCYLGQELTARTKHRGLVRKRLIHVRVEGTPPFGADILKNGISVGSMRSSASGHGLAMLRLDALEEAGELTCEGNVLFPVVA